MNRFTDLATRKPEEFYLEQKITHMKNKELFNKDPQWSKELIGLVEKLSEMRDK